MPVVAQPRRLIVLLAALVAFAPLSIDMYLPSLPLIARDLQAAQAQLRQGVDLRVRLRRLDGIADPGRVETHFDQRIDDRLRLLCRSSHSMDTEPLSDDLAH